MEGDGTHAAHMVDSVIYAEFSSLELCQTLRERLRQWRVPARDARIAGPLSPLRGLSAPIAGIRRSRPPLRRWEDLLGVTILHRYRWDTAVTRAAVALSARGGTSAERSPP